MDSKSQNSPEVHSTSSETGETKVISIEDVLLNYDKPWWLIPNIVLLNVAIMFITITSSNSGYDSSVLNGFQALDSWMEHMGHPKGAILGAVIAGYTFGSMAGSMVASWISDNWGRTRGVLIGEGITVLGAILQGVSTNYAFFLITRIILGFGSSVAAIAATLLIAEIAYPPHRSTLTCSYGVFWYFGALIASGITYGTQNMSGDHAWKVPSFLQGALPLIQCIAFLIMPESPRFLISKGRMEEARSFFKKYHAAGRDSPEANTLVEFEMMQVETAIELEKIQDNSRYTDFFSTKGNRKRLFLTVYLSVMGCLSGNSLVSYYLNIVLDSIGITTADEQLKINMGLMGYNLVVSIAAAIACYKLKRRHQFLTSSILMLFTFISWTAISAVNQKTNFENKSLAKGVLAMIFLYYLGYDLGLNGLAYLYETEIMNFALRAKGMNINSFCFQIFAIYTGFVDPVAMDSIKWKYYIFYCCLIAIEVPVVFFIFPETSGYTLEEIGTIFGDDATEGENLVAIKTTQRIEGMIYNQQ